MGTPGHKPAPSERCHCSTCRVAVAWEWVLYYRLMHEESMQEKSSAPSMAAGSHLSTTSGICCLTSRWPRMAAACASWTHAAASSSKGSLCGRHTAHVKGSAALLLDCASIHLKGVPPALGSGFNVQGGIQGTDEPLNCSAAHWSPHLCACLKVSRYL